MSNTFDDICRELATELEAATDALVTPVLGPKRPGRGVDEVRERIKREFERVRTPHTEPLICRSEPVPAPLPSRPRKPLAEIAVPILKVAERRYTSTPVRQHHFKSSYDVVLPSECAEVLVQQALAALSNFPQPKDERYEIAEEKP